MNKDVRIKERSVVISLIFNEVRTNQTMSILQSLLTIAGDFLLVV